MGEHRKTLSPRKWSRLEPGTSGIESHREDKCLTNLNHIMKAKAIFYKDSTDCTLAVPNSKGGTTFHPFEHVSEMVNYCNEHHIEATPVLED